MSALASPTSGGPGYTPATSPGGPGFTPAAILILFTIFIVTSVHADMIAFDRADNDPYPLGFETGQNGGYGYTGWQQLGDEIEVGSMYTANDPLDPDPEYSYSWGMSGNFALGRGLAAPTNTFTWTFLARHNSDSAFSGFNLKTSTNTGFATDEVLRFGLDLGSQQTGFYVSTNQGTSYTFKDCGWLDATGDGLLYSVTWSSGDYSITVQNLDESDQAGTFSETAGVVGNIAMFGAGVDGNTLDETLLFDRFAVVPEPGAALLFGTGLLLLCAIRRK
jgi:hypothetical protein